MFVSLRQWLSQWENVPMVVLCLIYGCLIETMVVSVRNVPMVVSCVIYGCLNDFLMSSWVSDSCLAYGCLNICFIIYLWLSWWLSNMLFTFLLCSISVCLNFYLMCDFCIGFVYHMLLSSLILLRLGLYLGEHLSMLCTLYVCTPQVSLN